MDSNLPGLTPRLSLIASYVQKGAKIADIGTDHAYLPVWLINSGIAVSAVASDISEGPLESARKTACIYNAVDKVTFVKADGLQGVYPSQADEIIIAGMGGELISAILAQCEWIKNSSKRLILQPMTAQAELHDFLSENGYSILEEKVAAEKHNSKLYLVISAVYTGEIFKADPVFRICGTLSREGGQNERLYLEHQAQILKKKSNGLRASKNGDLSEAQRADRLAEKILEICVKMG